MAALGREQSPGLRTRASAMRQAAVVRPSARQDAVPGRLRCTTTVSLVAFANALRAACSMAGAFCCAAVSQESGVAPAPSDAYKASAVTTTRRERPYSVKVASMRSMTLLSLGSESAELSMARSGPGCFGSSDSLSLTAKQFARATSQFLLNHRPDVATLYGAFALAPEVSIQRHNGLVCHNEPGRGSLRC